MMQDLLYSIVTLKFFSKEREYLFKQYFSACAVQLFRRSVTAMTFALFCYNFYELLGYESSRTVGRIVCCIALVPMGVATAYVLQTAAFKQNAEQHIIGMV